MNSTRIRLLLVAALGFGLLCSSGCGPAPTKLQLGLHTAALTDAQILAIRSFRVMAFTQDIYRCNPKTGRVLYTRVGFSAMATLDWSLQTGAPSQLRLYLPKDATNKTWVLLVEAFSTPRADQLGTQPLASGCTSDIQVFDERPLPVSVTLHAQK